MKNNNGAKTMIAQFICWLRWHDWRWYGVQHEEDYWICKRCGRISDTGDINN